jgi:1-acyl-sn-glycerol-3-phosphate acyltransferase
MRSFTFNLTFKIYSLLVALLALPLTLLPWRAPLAWALQSWAKGTLLLMRGLAGIRVEVRGEEHLPKDGPVVFAGKHQAECDGIIMLSLVPNLAVVAMQELGKIPIAGRLLRRLQMVLVDTCGGGRQREALINGARAVRAQGRSILIYPEGTLMKVGEKERYRPGVYHVAADLGLPVVPVATNMGLRWDRRMPKKTPGTAVVEFLPPIAADAGKDIFMARLEETIEARTEALVAEERNPSP